MVLLDSVTISYPIGNYLFQVNNNDIRITSIDVFVGPILLILNCFFLKKNIHLIRGIQLQHVNFNIHSFPDSRRVSQQKKQIHVFLGHFAMLKPT